MTKGLTSLWLRGLKRATKAQQGRNEKLIKSLFPKPTVKRAKSKISPAKRAPGPAPKQSNVTHSAPLPGKWLASYYSSFAETGTLPARRMNYWLYLPSKASATP